MAKLAETATGARVKTRPFVGAHYEEMYDNRYVLNTTFMRGMLFAVLIDIRQVYLVPVRNQPRSLWVYYDIRHSSYWHC